MHKIGRYVNFGMMLYILGIVDQVHNDSVQVELNDENGILTTEDIPRWMFPCEVSEGDMFYFVKLDGILELRCGEPPE